MKKNYFNILWLCVSLLLVVQSGLSQNNPFSAKQKSSVGNKIQTQQPQPLSSISSTNYTSATQNSQSFKYSTHGFIAPNGLEKESFTSLRYDEKGLIIFAESKPEKGKKYNLRSSEDAIDAGYAYLTDISKAMKINNPENEFVNFDQWTDELGIQHIKLQQTFQGLEVFGGQVILHGKRGEINMFNGTYFPTPELNDVNASIPEDKATEIVIDDMRSMSIYRELEDAEKELLEYDGPVAKLVVYHDSRDLTSEKLAYHIRIRPNVLDHYTYFVDAKNGEILDKYNTTCTDGPATTQSVDLNGVTQTINTYLVGNQYYLIDASRPMYNSAQSDMPNSPVGAIWTIDANNTNMQNLEVSQIMSSDNSFGFPTAVSAHNSAGITYEYFRNTHNRNSIDGVGGTIISIINVTDENGGGLDNAFWNGKAMFYGNGNQVFLPLAGGLDVGAHEMSHGVTQHTANLEYKDQSGAINEAMSDIVGCMVDREDWQLGEDIIPANSSYYPTGFMRDMKNPHNGGTSIGDGGYQPSHTDEMYTGDQDNGGVHINSGIINHAYYQLAENVSKSKAEKLYYRALSNYMTKSSQFIDCRLAFEQAAKDLYGDNSSELNAVATAFYNVGIGGPGDGGEGTDPPGELPPNPGQDWIMFVYDEPGDPTNLYITDPDLTNFYPTSQSEILSRPSITDDGSVTVFIDGNKNISAIDLTADPFYESVISTDLWDNVAVSKDGRRVACVTTEVDSSIWVYDFGLQQFAKFKLYNPTFTEGIVTYNVLYADALEWDYSGEYLIYDAYNSLENDSGEDIDYWDLGFLKVWDNGSNYWDDGDIFKLFSSLPEGINIGNPSLSKNSPFIMAFDYFDNNTGETKVLAANLETGDMSDIFQNQVLGFPNYSIDDKQLVFTAMSTANREVVAITDMKNDKISPSGDPQILLDYSKWPVWFAQGERNLTALEEFNNTDFFVNAYPNPVSDQVNISFEAEQNSEYTIGLYNLYGQLFNEIKGVAKQGINYTVLDTKELSFGTYFLRITVDNKMKTEKIAKVR